MSGGNSPLSPRLSPDVENMLDGVHAILAQPEPYPFANLLSTRQPILEEVMRRFDGTGGVETSHVVWMTGPQGSGKSTLAHRFMRMLHGRKRLAGAVLMWPYAAARQESVFMSLRGQLTENVSGYQDAWEKLQLDNQFGTSGAGAGAGVAQTLLSPFENLSKDEGGLPKILILDNVQNKVWETVKTITHSFTSSTHIPFRIFVTSTPETASQCIPTLALANSTQLYQLDLSSALAPLVQSSLDTLKTTHRLCSEIQDPSWPSKDELDTLVARSVQSPFYASLSIEFLSNPLFSPKARLTALISSPLENDTKSRDKFLYPLFQLIVNDALKNYTDPGLLAKCLAYLSIYLDKSARDLLEKSPVDAYHVMKNADLLEAVLYREVGLATYSLTSTQFLISVLCIPDEVVRTLKGWLHPFIYDAGEGRLDFVRRDAMIHLHGYLPKVLVTPNWSTWLQGVHCDIAIGCLKSITNQNCTTESSYPAIYFSYHLRNAGTNLRHDLVEALNRFELAGLLALGPSQARPPEGQEQEYQPRRIFFNILPHFTHAILRRFPDKRDTYIAQLTRHLTAILPQAYQSREQDVLVTLTSLEPSLHTYLSSQSSSNPLSPVGPKPKWVDYREAKRSIVGPTSDLGSDPLGLLDSFELCTSIKPSDANGWTTRPIEVFAAAVELDGERCARAALWCLTYLVEVFSPQDKFVFISDPSMTSTYKRLSEAERTSYTLCVYYISKLLPLSVHWRKLGEYIKQHVDVSQNVAKSRVAFDKEAAEAVRVFFEAYEKALAPAVAASADTQGAVVVDFEGDDKEEIVPPRQSVEVRRSLLRPASLANGTGLANDEDEDEVVDEPEPEIEVISPPIGLDTGVISASLFCTFTSTEKTPTSAAAAAIEDIEPMAKIIMPVKTIGRLSTESHRPSSRTSRPLSIITTQLEQEPAQVIIPEVPSAVSEMDSSPSPTYSSRGENAGIDHTAEGAAVPVHDLPEVYIEKVPLKSSRPAAGAELKKEKLEETKVKMEDSPKTMASPPPMYVVDFDKVPPSPALGLGLGIGMQHEKETKASRDHFSTLDELPQFSEKEKPATRGPIEGADGQHSGGCCTGCVIA